MPREKTKGHCILCGNRTDIIYKSKKAPYVPLCFMCHRHANTNRHQFTRFFYENNDLLRQIDTVVVNESLFLDKADVMDDQHWCKELIVNGSLFIENNAWLKRLPKKISTTVDFKVFNCSGLMEMPEAISTSKVLTIWDCPSITDPYDCSMAAEFIYFRDCKNLTRLPKNLHAQYIDIHGCPNLSYIPPSYQRGNRV